MAIAAGAMALLRTMTRGALRQTKHLSPWKSKFSYSGKGLADKAGKFRKTRFKNIFHYFLYCLIFIRLTYLQLLIKKKYIRYKT